MITISAERIPTHHIHIGENEITISTKEELEALLRKAGDAGTATIFKLQPRDGVAVEPHFGQPGELFPIKLSYEAWLRRNDVEIVGFAGAATPAATPSTWQRIGALEASPAGPGVLARVAGGAQIAYLDKVDIAELREVQWLTLPGGVKIGDVRFKGAIRGVLLVHNEGITFAPGKAGGHFR